MTMPADRETMIEELFHAALDRAPEDRGAFLDEACSGDPSLREEVESLLAALTKASDFPDKPAWAPLVHPAAQEGAGALDLEPEPGLPFERLGEFRLIGRIGEGGMGIAYLAVQESLGRKVCLKVIRPERMGSFEAEARFGREVEAVSELRHPGIVTVHGSGEEQGVRWFAMELVPGSGLDEILRETASGEKAVDLPGVLNWTRDVALALDCAHGAGVIHRDVKPSNIRITPDGRAMLLDFGVARHVNLSSLTLTGEFRGTPHYASPEQVKAQRREIDARTDVYSLGVTLYEAMTGRVPFEGETTEQVFHQILVKEPLPPRRLNPSIPRDLQTVILKAVEKEPARRYETMAAFAEDLRRLLEGEMILARPSGFATRALKRIRRHPAASITAGVAVLALAALAVAVPIFLGREKTTRSLADSRILARLVAEEQQLWPARPEKAAGLEKWLAEAAGLAARLDGHRREIEELRAGDRAREFNDPSKQQRHDTLSELVSGTAALTEEGTVESVRKRLNFARTVRAESIDERREDWDRAIASIADESKCSLYAGLVIEPCIGLVPLGRDPESGLWEFAHLQTGRVPERGADQELRITDESGLVLVLVPGGTFTMGAVLPGPDRPEGAPNVDPRARPVEGPVHAVTLELFFISKYEMTQGQWLRFTGRNPSQYLTHTMFGDKQHSLLHPVENISWEEAKLILFRLGLRLPSEAEWEYAARAGTASPWWTGNEKESLAGAANLMDLFCKKYGGASDTTCEEWLDDGYVVHAPVDLFRSNPFGLKNVCGNVYEWCEDAWHSGYSGAPLDGSAWTDPSLATRVCRNACWDGSATTCRAAYRIWRGKEYRDCGLGVRPALSCPVRAGDGAAPDGQSPSLPDNQ